MKNKYRLQSKYPNAYKELEEALEIYADEHELKGHRYQTDTGAYKYNAIAAHILEWINETFKYIPNHHERVINFLQGLGLSIPYSYHDIYQLCYKDGTLKESDSESKHLKRAENYWNFMAMRLQNIASSKN